MSGEDDKSKLVAANHSIEEMRVTIGADSFGFFPLEALRKLSPHPNHYCYACMDGNYW